MRIGVRAHDFGKLPVDTLAQKIADKGFSCIQLALLKAIEGIDNVDGRLSPGLANHIKEAFYKRGIQIAVLGCYINPIHPDKEERKKQIRRFKEHIRYARDFSCSVVATETGSCNADFSFHPENHGENAFQLLLQSLEQLVEEAEKFGVIVGMEGVIRHVVHTPERIKRVLDAIDSNNLQIVFDPVNLISLENYLKQRDLFEEAFNLFGDRMIAFHAKDFIVQRNEIQSVPPGKGQMDYEFVMKLLESHKPYIHFLLEDNKLHTMDDSIRYIQDICERSK